MNKRNIVLAMVLSSFLGGILAIGGYVIVQPAPQNMIVPTAGVNPVSFTNYVFDSTDFVVPEGLNFVYAAKAATPAVVHIRTKYTRELANYRSPLDEFFRDWYGDRGQQPQPQPYEGRGAGSGVVISSDGYIATNNHVIDHSTEIEVVLNDNRSFKAQVIGTDPDTDLALIKIDAENLPTINFGDSENIQVGEWVLAIGNPFEYRSTVTAGIVSAKGRNIGILRNRVGDNQDRSIESFIQTDAAVNPGNSGGALVNLKGELVGINTAIASPTGAFAGYSFAVPVTLVKKVIWDLKDYGAVQRPLLGITIRDMNAEIASEYDLEILKGVYVAEITPGSAAEDAGLQPNDIIVAIDDNPITNTSQLQEAVALNRPGDKITVKFYRNGSMKTVDARLKNVLNTMEVVSADGAFEMGGATFIPVSDELKEKLDIEGGLQIKELNSGRWKDARIKEGFIVTRFDRRDIKTSDDLSRAIANVRNDGALIEGYYPNGEKAYYGIGW